MTDEEYFQSWRRLARHPELRRYQELLEDPRLPDASFASLYAQSVAQQLGQPLPPHQPAQLESGALLASSSSRWCAAPLPSPRLQLEASQIYRSLERVDIAEKCATWAHQVAEFDVEPALFVAEKEYTTGEPVEPPTTELQFVDHEVGLISHRDENCFAVATNCGWGSGLGSLRYGDVHILTFGPQLSPLGDCSGFGLWQPPGLHKPTISTSERGFDFEGAVRVAQPQWCEVRQKLEKCEWSLEVNWLQEIHPFLFYVHCNAIEVGDLRLTPQTLQQYRGQSQPVKLGPVCLEFEGKSELQIIPLAGGQNFWGSTFLIAYTKGEGRWRLSCASNRSYCQIKGSGVQG